MRYTALLFAVLFTSCSRTTTLAQIPAHLAVDEKQTLTTIAFGSCNKETEPQPMWPVINTNKPELWIWLGDNIYGDTKDTALLHKKYDIQKSNPNYQQFMKQTPVIGTWDDHDYGINDGGKEWSIKKESQQLLLNFLDVPKEAEVRKREGVYQSFTFGKDGQKVKIILLDARYHRDKIERVNRKYQPNLDGDVLGEAQWQWLENELKDTSIQLLIIGNGTQVLPNDHTYEKWGNLPKSRDRFLDLIPNHTILLSGDRHMGEISQVEHQGKVITEVTSSGLTHSWESLKEEKNVLRKGNFVNQLNFGLIQINWKEKIASLQIRGKENQVYEEIKVNF